VWLRPCWDHENQIAHPATADDVAEALQRHPEISAALIITPTEYGTGADVRGIAEICHRHGIPLLVDEAWGAHFPFHPELPTAAAQAGADIAVQSLHKADGGCAQHMRRTAVSGCSRYHALSDPVRLDTPRAGLDVRAGTGWLDGSGRPPGSGARPLGGPTAERTVR
jgi:hypothetical protein